MSEQRGYPKAIRGDCIWNGPGETLYRFDDGTVRDSGGYGHYEPCRTCETWTSLGQPRAQIANKDFQPSCTNCWEVEHRLADYLRSAAGVAFAQEALFQQSGKLCNNEDCNVLEYHVPLCARGRRGGK